VLDKLFSVIITAAIESSSHVAFNELVVLVVGEYAGMAARLRRTVELP
jgi:hypothetical protein